MGGAPHDPEATTISSPAIRRLRPVPWCHGGREGLVATAGIDVPSFDESMILDALARGAGASGDAQTLTRVLNRELWSIGYVARLEPDLLDQSRLLVRIASSR